MAPVRFDAMTPVRWRSMAPVLDSVGEAPPRSQLYGPRITGTLVEMPSSRRAAVTGESSAPPGAGSRPRRPFNRCRPPRTRATPSISRLGQRVEGRHRSIRAFTAASPAYPVSLQPALEVAGVGGGRGRILGEPLDGVAQPLRHRRQRLPQPAAVGIEPERDAEQHDRFRRQVDHLVTADRGGNAVDEQAGGGGQKRHARLDAHALVRDAVGQLRVAERRIAWHVRCHASPRAVSSNARASFVRVCTRSSGGVFVGQNSEHLWIRKAQLDEGGRPGACRDTQGRLT